MVEVYSSRFSPGVTGESIKWEAGERAVFVTQRGARENVSILDGEYVTHDGAPGVRCIEVRGEDGTVFCVPARQLEWLTMAADHTAGSALVRGDGQ